MLALLLKKNRKEVRSEYRHRFVTVLLLVISLVLIFTIIFLGSIWFVIEQIDLAYTKETRNMTDQNIEELATQSKKMENEIINKFEILKEIKPIYYPIYDLINSEIDDLNTADSENIKLNSAKFNLVSRNIEIYLGGQAQNREALLKFVRALKDLNNSDGNEIFEGVDLPISNLTKDSNIEFNLNFKTKLRFFNNYQIK